MSPERFVSSCCFTVSSDSGFRVENTAVCGLTSIFYGPTALLKGIIESLHSWVTGTSSRKSKGEGEEGEEWEGGVKVPFVIRKILQGCLYSSVE